MDYEEELQRILADKTPFSEPDIALGVTPAQLEQFRTNTFEFSTTRKFLLQNARAEHLVADTLFFAPTAEDVYVVYQGVCGRDPREVFGHFAVRFAKAGENRGEVELLPRKVEVFKSAASDTFDI